MANVLVALGRILELRDAAQRGSSTVLKRQWTRQTPGRRSAQPGPTRSALLLLPLCALRTEPGHGLFLVLDEAQRRVVLSDRRQRPDCHDDHRAEEERSSDDGDASAVECLVPLDHHATGFRGKLSHPPEVSARVVLMVFAYYLGKQLYILMGVFDGKDAIERAQYDVIINCKNVLPNTTLHEHHAGIPLSLCQCSSIITTAAEQRQGAIWYLLTLSSRVTRRNSTLCQISRVLACIIVS